MLGKRVVVTGMGVICPIGNSVAEAWQNAAAGKPGIGPITLWDTSQISVKIAGEVKNFDPLEAFGRRDSRRMDRFTQLGMYATIQAVEDSGLIVTEENRYHIGVLMGTGIGGFNTIMEGVQNFLERGEKGVGPLIIPMLLPDSASGKISIHYGMRGPNMSISTACATGNNSIGEAYAIIARGDAKVMVAGSAEAGVIPIGVASFNNMTALSRRNDSPETASRPFDKDRDGFVCAEGAATLILEELDHALARGAKIYAEIVGYGSTSDGYHITAPMETGEGACAAMQHALEDAGMTIEEIDYINAHGTSTHLNDLSETLAIKKTFGERAYEIPVSSTKSMTGHMLGAAGSVEAVFSIQAILNNFVPPTINYDTPDPECDLDYVPNVGRTHTVNAVMSNSFGFGGHNAVLIFKRYYPNNGVTN